MFLIIVSLIIPVTSIVLGVIYRSHYPKKINAIHGYRTSRAMKNQESWEFAQKAFGRVALKLGILSLLISIAFLACFVNHELFEWISLILIFIQMIIFLSIIYFVERELKHV